MQIKYKLGSYELLWTNTAHEIHLGRGVRILKVFSLKKNWALSSETIYHDVVQFCLIKSEKFSNKIYIEIINFLIVVTVPI